MGVTTKEFRDEIYKKIEKAKEMGLHSIVINSGELHRNMGGYPGKGHSMPSCCDAMRSIEEYEIVEISSPPKGKGATLTLEYRW